MKRILLWTGVGIGTAGIAVILILLLCTCAFGNHAFSEATCTEPETCSRCGETRGEALGHDYAEATCETPETCSRCGIRRGEPLGHAYREATCLAPETCARCGQTRGEPLGHSMTDATFQTPATCTRCGITEGEPKTAALSGKTLNELTVGVPAPYTTASYEDRDVDVTGTVEILDYEVIDGSGTFPARDGYEWHVATVQLVFSGDDARKNGAQSAVTFGDWYLLDDQMAARADENGLRPFVADWYGIRVQCWQKTGPGEEADWFGRELRFTWQEGVLVPKGYDGVLLIFYNYRLFDGSTRLYLPASEVLDESTPVFRMK
jgi:hypothetical protein